MSANDDVGELILYGSLAIGGSDSWRHQSDPAVENDDSTSRGPLIAWWSRAANAGRSAQILRKGAFFLVLLFVETLKVGAGNEPHDSTVFQQRHMSKPAVPHQTQSIDSSLIR